MLTIWGHPTRRGCDRTSRRDFLRIGTLGLAGLALPDLFRLRAQGAVDSKARAKSVIWIFLGGGPPHTDMYDLKPEAPKEYRGEFKPIQTKVPGMDICELMPLQAKLADKMAIVRSWVSESDGGTHSDIHLWNPWAPTSVRPAGQHRPGFGSVVSKFRGFANGMPPYVATRSGGSDGGPAFLGKRHEVFALDGPRSAANDLPLKMAASRLQDRKQLLRSFDALQRDVLEANAGLAGADHFTTQALDMIGSTKLRDAVDLSREPEAVRARYGRCTTLLQARRLAEAGVSVVSASIPIYWDTHSDNFNFCKKHMPEHDQAVATLLDDLHQRGLDKEVLVVIWGEFGRTPRINAGGVAAGGRADALPGRDHYVDAGFVLMAGGGLQMGQVVGATDRVGARPAGKPYKTQNVLATLYHALGIDPDATLPDLNGRPMYLLDDREPIRELL